MNITISYWVAYGVFLFINLSQFFWGLSLESNREKVSYPTLASWIFPLGTILVFGITLGLFLPSILNTVDPSRKIELVSSLFIFWAFITAVLSIIMLIRHFKK